MNYNLIISCILLLLVILKIYGKIDIPIQTIIIISVITVLLLLKINSNGNSNEHLNQQEILENVASIYNSRNMVVTNLTVTGKLTVGDPTTNNVKMTVNDPTVDSGNTVDINKCNVLTRDVNVSNILTSTNTANINNLTVNGVSNLKTTNIIGSANVSGTTTTQNLNVEGNAQQVLPIPSGQVTRPPNSRSFLRHNDEIKLVLTGSVPSGGFQESSTWGQGWEMGYSGLGTGMMGIDNDEIRQYNDPSYVRDFKLFNPFLTSGNGAKFKAVKFNIVKL